MTRSCWRSSRSWSTGCRSPGSRPTSPVAWNTALDAILAVGTQLLIDSADQVEGVTAVGVDEHVVRHEALLYRMGVGDLHWLAVVAAK